MNKQKSEIDIYMSNGHKVPHDFVQDFLQLIAFDDASENRIVSLMDNGLNFREAFIKSGETSILFCRSYERVIESLLFRRKNINGLFSDVFLKQGKQKTTTYIYIMIDSRNNLYKIGISVHPTIREKTIQSEVPKVRLLAYFEGSNETEKELHEKYKNLRVRGEWFRLSIFDIIDILETYTTLELKN